MVTCAVVLDNRGMRKEELERRCAEMRAKYAAPRTGKGVPYVETRTTPPARQKATTPPLPPAVKPTPNYEIVDPHPLIKATLKGSRALRVGWRAQDPFERSAPVATRPRADVLGRTSHAPRLTSGSRNRTARSRSDRLGTPGGWQLQHLA